MCKRVKETRSSVSTRRQFLIGGAAATAGVAATSLGLVSKGDKNADTPKKLNGSAVVPFYGVHQAGIDTDAQAHATFVALDLHKRTDLDALRRMMRILTDDAARMTGAKPALADTEPELAETPARLTATFGFGGGFLDRTPVAKPKWLRALPGFSIDDLRNEYCFGDVFIQIAADDPLTVAHATRMLLKDARGFARLRWSQSGFRRAYGSVASGTTMRNLFGQVDGTRNPRPGSKDFDRVVWSDSGWLEGGTSLVLRRIQMNLDKWDKLDRSGREQAIGRKLSNGAPLTGVNEHDEPDFSAVSRIGFPVIPEFSHVARAHSTNTRQQIFRRSYNYDQAPANDGISDSGLLFASYQADVDAQFVPIQRRLEKMDLLNEWTTPIGSAVFAIPPGCEQGGYIGETLLG